MAVRTEATHHNSRHGDETVLMDAERRAGSSTPARTFELELLFGTVKGVQSLEVRILDRRITAAVILERLGGHKHFEPIVSGSLRKAFGEIEKRLLSAK